MNAIQIQYDEVIRKAERLEALAAELDHLASHTLQNAIDTTKSGWSGTVSDEYCKKAMKLRDRAVRHARDLRQEAINIRNSAVLLRHVEEMAKSMIARP